MRGAVAFLAAVLAVVACSLALAAETTQSQTTEPDPRMEQKVTCTTGYVRLHDVVSELRTKSGVSVECGESPKDWNVRDIPVFVYVRDMRLGTLLRSIAAAAHVQFVRQKSSDDRPPGYRLYRTASDKRLIEGQMDERLKAGMDYAKWAWSAMAAYGRSTDASLADSPKSSLLTPEMAKAAAKVIASMSPRDEDTLFSTGQIKLLAKDCPQAALVLECGKIAWDLECSRKKFAAMPPIDLRDSFLIFNLYQAKAVGYTGLVMYGGLPNVTTKEANCTSTYTPSWTGDLMSQAAALTTVKGLNLSPKPDYDPSKPLADPSPGYNLTPIATDDDWKAALLQARVTIPKPATAADWKCADVLAAIAETGKINIVCEDFRSHRVSDASGLKFDFAPDGTAADALRQMGVFKWFSDADSSLLMGWDQSWRWYQKTLVEQAFLRNLKNKLNGPGVELDDFVPVVRLSIGQCDAWISRTRDLGELGSPFSDGTELWKLYDSLSPDQKSSAKSEEGLPLSALDAKSLSEFLSGDLDKKERGSVRLTADGEPAEVSLKRSVYADPAVLRHAVLRVRRQAKQSGTLSIVAKVNGVSVAQTPWVAELRGIKDEKEFVLQSKIPLDFPVRHGVPQGGLRIESRIRRN